MPTEESFQKQRKITLAFSTFVILFNIAGSKLSKINFLGNEILLNNPNSIKVILLIAMTYFFIRYLQFMHRIEEKGIKATFYKKVKEYVKPYLVNRIFERNRTNFVKELGSAKEVKIDSFRMYDETQRPGTAYIGLYKKEDGQIHEFTEEIISRKELIIPFIKSSIYITIRTHYFTEYVFPIIYIAIAYVSYVPSFRNIFGISL